jgi:hypothetical protein
MKPVAAFHLITAWDQDFIRENKQTNKQPQLCIVQLHLLLANLRSALQRYIENRIDEKFKIIFNIKHKELHNKTNDVTHNHISTPDKPVTVYPTVINKTNTEFSSEQLSISNKGTQYN